MKKIVNKKRFIISNTILFFLIVLLCSIIINSTYSKSIQHYKTIYVIEGDTLWKIASIEKTHNEVYKNEDVRDIIQNIKKTNNLTVSDLKIGQELKIPIK